MLLVNSLPKSDVFQMIQTITPMNETIEGNESANLQPSKSMIEDTTDSISPIDIPLISSQPILTVSPNYILTNEYTKKRNQLVFINNNLQRFFIRSPITEPIIDALWYNIEEKFLLLTARKIFTCDPNEKIIEPISDIKSDDKKPFKSFTIDNNQSSLLIAYDEWESKFIDRWKQDKENGRWKLIKRHPLNLTSNEFIGIILAINENDCLKVGITIYNDLFQEWRIELRHTEMLTYFKKILLPGSDPIHDYRMIAMKNLASDIEWLVHSQVNNEIIAIDSKWKMIRLKYKFPVYRMAQFGTNNLIMRTRNRIEIHLFI